MLLVTPGHNGQSRPPGPAANMPGAGPQAIRPARILLVEDDYLVALELESHLLEAGFLVVGTAATAEEALVLAASEKPELAIMDIRLAGLRDGIDAAIELISKFSIPSLFATAHANEAMRKRGEEAKPLAWLQKPYSADTLIAVINKVLAAQR